MNIIEYVDSQYSLVQKLHSDRAVGSYYASSASVELKNLWGEPYIEGTCLRAQYYRLTTSPIDNFQIRNTRTMDYGDAIHEHEIARMAAARILVASEFPIVVREHNISGRGDALIINPFSKSTPTELMGAEIKTVGGNWGVITGGRGSLPKPKPGHLLQTAIYLDWGRKKHGIRAWKLLYFSRIDGKSAEYTVTLTDKGEISVDGELTNIFVDKIYERFRQLTRYLNSSELPPRDYDLVYDKTKLLKMTERQQLTKKEIAMVNSDKPIFKGDWNCKYCDYKTLCYPDIEGESNVETDW